MDVETKDFVSGLLLKHAGKLPKNKEDWMGVLLYHAAPYIMEELCTALDIYEEVEND